MDKPQGQRRRAGQEQRNGPWRTLRPLLIFALASLWLILAPPGAIGADPLPSGVAAADGVLAKVKAAHPDAAVLKIELLQAEEADLPEWIYEVKLFPPDGRILRLTYDAKTLALLETAGGGHHCRHGGGHKRMRMRQGWRHNGAGQ